MHILGIKLGTTQIFAPDGSALQATLVRVPEAIVTQIRSQEKDGYKAVQVGTDIVADEKSAAKKIAKPQRGHNMASGKYPRKIYEVVWTGEENPKVGEVVAWEHFVAGDIMNVAGVSRGHGFAGVVKRHHFRGGPASHGHKHNLRAPGSIGAQQPQHVVPGKKMAGHMGAERVTVKGVEVIQVLTDERAFVLKGNVPGPVNGWIELHVTGKKAGAPVHERKSVVDVDKVEKTEA